MAYNKAPARRLQACNDAVEDGQFDKPEPVSKWPGIRIQDKVDEVSI